MPQELRLEMPLDEEQRGDRLPAFLSLLTGGPGGWCFRKGWRGPAPCLKAFPDGYRVDLFGRAGFSLGSRPRLGTSAWTGFLWVCAGSQQAGTRAQLLP